MCPATKRVETILEEQSLKQFVNKPTHKKGHILDWVIGQIESNIILSVQVKDKAISDHALIISKLNFEKQLNAKKEITFRNIKGINADDFKTDLKNLLSVDDVVTFDAFDTACKKVLDIHAPLRTKKLSDRFSSPWFTLAEKEAKAKRRQAERQWNRSGLQIHRDIFIYYKRMVNKLCDAAKQNYYNSKFECVKNCKDMYRLTNALFAKNQDPVFPTNIPKIDLPNSFSSFFCNKVEKIRHGFTPSDFQKFPDSQFTGNLLFNFESVSNDDVMKIIRESNTKSCELDSLPTPLLKECISDIIPHLSSIINESLASGIVPDKLKSSLVNPLLKKTDLDHNELNNYRPVSNLTYVSKILEKVVLKQVLGHIHCNKLEEIFQSAYKKAPKRHSSEFLTIY